MPDTFNTRMREARDAARLTLDDVLIAVRTRLPDVFHASRATLGRLERDIPEAKADPYLVQFLCSLYGVDFETVAPVLVQALRDYAEIVDIRATEQEATGSPCNQDSRSNDLVGV